jgi:hypothetical protein
MAIGKGTNYIGDFVKADQILQGSPNFNVEVSEGQTPPGEFYPAPYLPTVLPENRIAGSGYVLMPGKVVSYDKNKRLVPAGLAMDVQGYYDTYKADFDDVGGANGVASVAHATAQAAAGSADIFGHKYGSNDAGFGVITVGKTRPEAGEFVAESLVTAGYTNASFSAPVGIMRYSKLMSPGMDPSNPFTFTRHAYDTGGSAAYSRWCYIQVPVIELNKREEPIPVGAVNFRIRVYNTGSLTIRNTNTNADVTTCKEVYSPQAFVLPTNPGDAPTQFAVMGRTIFFNNPVPANWAVRYLPKVDLPFSGLVVGDAAQYAGGDSVLSLSSALGLCGQDVGFDFNSNYGLASDLKTDVIGGDYNRVVGRILDMKNGASEDLKLVRTYFRDQGLWQEQPGDATDGRNTQLSIVNAPKWIAKIAVNFESTFAAL